MNKEYSYICTKNINYEKINKIINMCKTHVLKIGEEI